jgi:hypothetical protein
MQTSSIAAAAISVMGRISRRAKIILVQSPSCISLIVFVAIRPSV